MDVDFLLLVFGGRSTIVTCVRLCLLRSIQKELFLQAKNYSQPTLKPQPHKLSNYSQDASGTRTQAAWDKTNLKFLKQLSSKDPPNIKSTLQKIVPIY